MKLLLTIMMVVIMFCSCGKSPTQETLTTISEPVHGKVILLRDKHNACDATMIRIYAGGVMVDAIEQEIVSDTLQLPIYREFTFRLIN